MKKRSRYKVETPTTKALKRIREASGLSIVKAAKAAGINPHIINHAENGRRNSISEDFLKAYITSLGFSWEDWEDFLKGRKTVYDLRQECKASIDQLDIDKLKAIHTMLSSFIS